MLKASDLIGADDRRRALKAYLERLFQHAAWADQRTLAALRDTPAAHAEGLPLLAHLLAAEHVWLRRLQLGEPRHAVWPTLDIDQCASLAAENAAGYEAFLGQLPEERLADAIRYRTSQGKELVTSIIDILTHVTLHGPYHRGQIAKIIGRHGGVAISTDFIMFVWETNPQA